MSDLKLKTIASIVIFAVTMSSLSVSTAGTAHACTYLPVDLNHDGIVDIEDVLILAPAWQSRVGDANFNPCCDFNKDGIIDIKDVSFLAVHWTRFLKAHMVIMPQTLNLKSHGNWVTCIILLPAKVNASHVEISSIRLNNTIAVSPKAPICRFSCGLIVKFSREAVITLIRQNLDSEVSVNCGKSIHITLAVSGALSSGLKFSGSDTIRVTHSNRCID